MILFIKSSWITLLKSWINYKRKGLNETNLKFYHRRIEGEQWKIINSTKSNKRKAVIK